MHLKSSEAVQKLFMKVTQIEVWKSQIWFAYNHYLASVTPNSNGSKLSHVQFYGMCVNDKMFIFWMNAWLQKNFIFNQPLYPFILCIQRDRLSQCCCERSSPLGFLL